MVHSIGSFFVRVLGRSPKAQSSFLDDRVAGVFHRIKPGVGGVGAVQPRNNDRWLILQSPQPAAPPRSSPTGEGSWMDNEGFLYLAKPKESDLPPRIKSPDKNRKDIKPVISVHEVYNVRETNPLEETVTPSRLHNTLHAIHNVARTGFVWLRATFSSMPLFPTGSHILY